jgi:hypothetical protein
VRVTMQAFLKIKILNTTESRWRYKALRLHTRTFGV